MTCKHKLRGALKDFLETTTKKLEEMRRLGPRSKIMRFWNALEPDSKISKLANKLFYILAVSKINNKLPEHYPKKQRKCTASRCISVCRFFEYRFSANSDYVVGNCENCQNATFDQLWTNFETLEIVASAGFLNITKSYILHSQTV